MRGLLQRVLGPGMEALFRRFEQSVSLEEHRDLAARIAEEAPPPQRTAAPGAPSPPPALASDWREDPVAVAALREAAARAFARLAADPDAAAAVAPVLAAWADALPARLWFPKRGALFGTGRLLRALIAVADLPDAATRDYTRDVCDRFLRHLEVRRVDYLPFRPHSLAAGDCPEEEKLLFTHALLDASERFGDLRCLNAALKANDWHHRALRSGRPARQHPEAAARVRHLYLDAFRRQEALMHEAFGS